MRKAFSRVFGAALAVGLSTGVLSADPGIDTAEPGLAPGTPIIEAPDEPSLAAPPSVVQRLAPRVRLHPDEQFWPISAHTFINNSASLKWHHDYNCSDDVITTNISKTSLANGSYEHREKNAPGCGHHKDAWRSNQSVRPREDGGPAGAEGMFLNLYNEYRDGAGFSGDEPVYFQLTDKYVQYWFTYGFSQTLNIGRHEGDWERIAIKLDSSDNPVSVQYFYHHSSCTLPWSEAPKHNGRPIVWAVKEAHGSYPKGATTKYGDKISGDGPLWNTLNNLDKLSAQSFYGYGGGWGEVGATADFTGPDGPPHKGGPGFATAKCEL